MNQLQISPICVVFVAPATSLKNLKIKVACPHWLIEKNIAIKLE